MKRLIILVGVLLVSLSMIRCEDSLDGSTFTAYEEQPVGIYLETQPQYSEWVKLLKRTNIYNALNVKTKFTCFVADNEAMSAYLKSKNYNSVEELPLSDAEYLMRYHIIPGTAYDHNMFSGQIADSTSSGDFLSVKLRDGGINAMYVNDYALITKKDITVINGYIHRIDRVLEPIMRSVWDIIDKDSRYKIFREAVLECQLKDWLSARNRVVTVGEEHINLRDYKTIFMVSDSIFQLNGIQSLADLKARYSGDGQDENSDFRKFVGYHIINSFADYGLLAEFPEKANKKKNMETCAKNELLGVEDVHGHLIFNRSSHNIKMVPGRYDLQANNGFVHEVDHLMPVTTPEPAYFRWEFTDLEDCRILPIYGKFETDQKLYAIGRENPVDVEWFTVPDNNTAVTYQTRKGHVNDNILYMNLGYVGWAKMKTPAVVQGKYKISIWKYAWSNRGTCQMYLDDEKVGPQLDFSGSGKNIQEICTKTFLENGRHEVKFSAIKAGNMEVDWMEFEPVK